MSRLDLDPDNDFYEEYQHHNDGTNILDHAKKSFVSMIEDVECLWVCEFDYERKDKVTEQLKKKGPLYNYYFDDDVPVLYVVKWKENAKIVEWNLKGFGYGNLAVEALCYICGIGNACSI